jgi:hypothetical protein
MFSVKNKKGQFPIDIMLKKLDHAGKQKLSALLAAVEKEELDQDVQAARAAVKRGIRL